MKLLYTSLNLLPWKQNSFVILFLQYLFLKGIILSKIIIYFASAYYAQVTADSNDNMAQIYLVSNIEKGKKWPNFQHVVAMATVIAEEFDFTFQLFS